MRNSRREKERKKKRQTDRKKDRKKETGWTDGQMNRRIDKQTNRQTNKAFSKVLGFPEILLRTNFREQTSPLEIRDQNLILSAPVPKNGDGKILKLNSGWSLLRAGPCSEVIVKTGLIVGRKQLNNTQRMSF